MSDADKAGQTSSEAEKRIQNMAKVAALMRYAPDLFDKQMADLANNPEAMRELAAVMPAKLTPEQRAKADKMLAELDGAADTPGGTPSDDRGAWTCGLCGFRGFWYGGTHDCQAAAAAGHQAKKPAPK